MEKNSSLMKKEFDKEPVYSNTNKYIKTKINSFGEKVNTNFQGRKLSKQNTLNRCSPMIMLDSVIKVGKKILSSNILEKV